MILDIINPVASLVCERYLLVSGSCTRPALESLKLKTLTHKKGLRQLEELIWSLLNNKAL